MENCVLLLQFNGTIFDCVISFFYFQYFIKSSQFLHIKRDVFTQLLHIKREFLKSLQTSCHMEIHIWLPQLALSIFEGVFKGFPPFFQKFVCTCNSFYILNRNSSKLSCLLIIIWRFTFSSGGFIGPFLTELLPLFD